MSRNQLLEQVSRIEGMELELTVFNAKRALSNIDKQLEVKKIGDCSLIFDIKSPNSIYYNRIKGFGINDLDKIEEILGGYYRHNITPCFDMTPNNINEEVSMALSRQGFIIAQQLVFMQAACQVYEDINKDIRIVDVSEKNAEEFVNIVISSAGGMDISSEVIARKKHFFYQDNFHNYIAYIGDKIAGIGSLFISGNEGYIANDFTFEGFRGLGIQTALLKHRANIAKEMDLARLYTDVEFGSVSHNNMEKLGFKTVFINSFYTKARD